MGAVLGAGSALPGALPRRDRLEPDAKRDTWGQQNGSSARPESDWLRDPAPALQIVTAEAWAAAQARSADHEAAYIGAKRAAWARPPLGSPSRNLLTGLSLCASVAGRFD